MMTYTSTMPLKEYCNVIFNKINNIPIVDQNEKYKLRRADCIAILRRILRQLTDITIIDVENYTRLSGIFSKMEDNFSQIYSIDGIEQFLQDLKWILKIIRKNEVISVEPLNSNDYYQDKVKELHMKIEALENELVNSEKIDVQLSHLQEQRDKAISEMRLTRKELEQKEKQTQEKTQELENLYSKNKQSQEMIYHLNQEINNLKSQEIETEKLKKELAKYEQQLQESKKRDDAVSSWNLKIKNAFSSLEEYIKPIKDEHDRLKELYIVYKYLSWILLITIFVFEILIALKITKCGGYPSWKDSIVLILPIPILLGLLWGFVTQMNRSQRQLVIIAKQMHEIKYTEGLLITLNTLSIDVGESMNRINEAINKLIDNHLNTDIKSLKDEDLLKKELQKDLMPYENVEKIVKTILEGIKTK